MNIYMIFDTILCWSRTVRNRDLLNLERYSSRIELLNRCLLQVENRKNFLIENSLNSESLSEFNISSVISFKVSLNKLWEILIFNYFFFFFDMRKIKCSYFHEVNVKVKDSFSFITISLAYEKPFQYYWKLYIF